MSRGRMRGAHHASSAPLIRQRFALPPSPARGEGAARAASADAVPFRQALAEVWAEPQARRFALFVFASMLAYSAQELVLEPFAGAVFGLSPGETTKLAGLQHAGLLVGMILVAVAGGAFAGRSLGSMRVWTAGGCLLSGLGVATLAAGALAGPDFPLRPVVFAAGIANGAFAISAIASMMQLVSSGRAAREGIRMGIWGGAQAIAFGSGGVLGAAASDLGRYLFGAPAPAYGAVFLGQAALFGLAAVLALRVFGRDSATLAHPPGLASHPSARDAGRAIASRRADAVVQVPGYGGAAL